MRYPKAEWVPWGYQSPEGPTYYRGANRPAAVVLHIMEGWATTARAWAGQAHYDASWHFTVGRDGHVMQHLEFADGGYHAGIAQYRPDGRPNPQPRWSLWRGWASNVNNYTIGVEHEGFSGTTFDNELPFTPAQAAASRALCQWLAQVLGIPYDREHFPPHADIALIDRVNDFAPRALRERYYEYLFQEDDMTPDEVRALITEALKNHPDDDIDDRLRQVMAWRIAGQQVFWDPDSAIVERAYNALANAGLITKGE